MWAIGAGLVISGEYFGWNYGWGVAGTGGFLLATVVITLTAAAAADIAWHSDESSPRRSADDDISSRIPTQFGESSSAAHGRASRR